MSSDEGADRQADRGANLTTSNAFLRNARNDIPQHEGNCKFNFMLLLLL